MLKVIRNLLLKIVDNIDAGNSNITEEEAVKIVDSLKRFTDKEKRLSKYAACEHLNISRATFDNYVREGKLPRGKHEIGFKELSWSEKELDESVNIAHESEHVKNAIWRFIGYEPQRDNDEVDAYLLTYIYNKITDVFYKHDSVGANQCGCPRVVSGTTTTV